ncbi:MAG: amidophosphoribosyltransferase, partial [Candidatus Lokiarchaeota archaeon]|nr:amidophosphoribosyltransferase [Candidatus Lokiarchaeota archaeon]
MLLKKINKQMREKPRENCAIFGITCNDLGYSVSKLLYQGLIALQHRGQESTGISLLKTGGKIYTYKKNGLVSKVLENPIVSQYWG